MAGDRALQRLELPLGAGVDPNRQRVRRSVEGHPCIAGPVGAARVLGEGHGAVVGGEFDGQIMLPVLAERSEEHTSELQSLMRISYAVFCLKKKKEHPIR